MIQLFNSAGGISIHAPRVGCDGGRGALESGLVGFQSTHPVWGATGPTASGIPLPQNFNPRTPCGVRLHCVKSGLLLSRISIHAPRVGCDRGGYRLPGICTDFNPRTPCGVRLLEVIGRTERTNISIHAPRVGCDLPVSGTYKNEHRFQSTHPVWGATVADRHVFGRADDFNPRTPCGVRPLVAL